MVFSLIVKMVWFSLCNIKTGFQPDVSGSESLKCREDGEWKGMANAWMIYAPSIWYGPCHAFWAVWKLLSCLTSSSLGVRSETCSVWTSSRNHNTKTQCGPKDWSSRGGRSRSLCYQAVIHSSYKRKNKGQKRIVALIQHIENKKQRGEWHGPAHPIPWQWDPSFQGKGSDAAPSSIPPWRQGDQSQSIRIGRNPREISPRGVQWDLRWLETPAPTAQDAKTSLWPCLRC